MQKNILGPDNFVFVFSALLSALICYLFLGAQSITLSAVAVLFTFVIYSAKPNNGDYLYTFLWLILILIGCYIGIWLKLSAGFYIFLFIVSSYYYISYQRDSFSDRAIPFIIIYASLGTTMKGFSIDSVFSFCIGSIVAIIVMGLVHRNKIEFSAFKTGLFSKSLYANPPHILLSAIIFSSFLFLCLYLPDKMGLQRPYWVPMTFVILLKPKDENIIKNTLTRFWGSVIGAIVVLIILKADVHYKFIDLLIIAICVFLLPSFFKLSNLYKTFGITVFILLLLELAGYWNDPNYSLPDTRIFETFIGGSLALIASVVLKKSRKIFH